MFDLLPVVEKIQNKKLKNWIFDQALYLMVPFNRGLGFKIESISVDGVTIRSPSRLRRKNHVKSAHACALAVLGEYAAGLLVAQKYPPNLYRPVIGMLHVDYVKQGRGVLTAQAQPPSVWPEIKDGEGWIEMTTKIRNEKNEDIATCVTKWQVKEWNKVRTKPT